MTVRRVVGHSMVPVLPPGTLVLGLRWFDPLRVGDVIILTHAGKEKIKRVTRIEELKIFVEGDHPETSTDSRHFGWLSFNNVRARVIWPRAVKVPQP